MKILITGIGITGKSTLRKLLKKIFSDNGLNVRDFDADYDCQKNPEKFTENTIYIIEDVHATISKESILPLSSYDLILYAQPSIISHILFWIHRMIIWFENGQYSYDQKNGWRGTGKQYDLRNIFPIFKMFLRDFKNRRKWISNDLKEISSFRYAVIRSQWIYNGIKFSWIFKKIKFSVKKTFAT